MRRRGTSATGMSSGSRVPSPEPECLRREGQRPFSSAPMSGPSSSPGTPEGEKALGVRLAIYAACGPATTLMLAAACRAGASAMEPATTLGSAVASHALLAGWWAGAFLGVMNLLPFRTSSGLITDGARILMAVLPISPGAESSDALKRALGAGAPAARLGHVSRVTSERCKERAPSPRHPSRRGSCSGPRCW